MKKAISITSLLMAAAIMTAPMSAFAVADEPTTITLTPDTTSGKVTVQYTVNPTYTITIPTKIELAGDTYGSTPEGSADIVASNVFLEPNKEIVIKISTENEFRMMNSGAELPYTATCGSNTVNTNGSEIARFSNSTDATTYASQSKTVNFTATKAATNAGTYTDLATFTISEETSTPSTT